MGPAAAHMPVLPRRDDRRSSPSRPWRPRFFSLPWAARQTIARAIRTGRWCRISTRCASWGGALVLMQDDVNDSLALIAQRRKETPRQPEFIEELTSRRTQAEVRDMLDRLAIRADAQGALDIVLATNMLSVGVDIPRLGLMLVNGQPKGIAEYIQAPAA